MRMSEVYGKECRRNTMEVPKVYGGVSECMRVSDEQVILSYSEYSEKHIYLANKML